ncbi:MAG: CopG family antitoxin [bacterium]
MKEQKKHHDPLPEKFASYEEAAEFWDTHDTTDYPDAFEDVEVKAEFRKRYFEIEIDEDVMVTLQRKANKLGVAVDRLASG